MNKEAMTLALDLAEDVRRYGESNLARKAIEVIKALKQEPDYSICPTCGGMADDPIVPPEHRHTLQEQDEPVAYVHKDELEELSHCNGMSVWAENALAHTDDSLSKQLLPSGYVAVYTKPQPSQKPLTDAEIDLMTDHIYHRGRPVDRDYRISIFRQAEAAHGIKE